MAELDVKTYHRGSGFGIVSVPGFEEPSIILDLSLVKHLGRVWHAANAQLAPTLPGQDFDAPRHLCELLAPIFKHFGAATVESAASNPLPPETAAILRELDEVAQRLEEFDPDNWPGGRGKA